MAQVAKQHITVGGSRIVGEVSADGGALRGEGGPTKPQLVVPLTIRMNNAPADAMVALCLLRARLALDRDAPPQRTVARPATELLLENLPARSLPDGQNEHTVPLRFHLTHADIAALENHRHQHDADLFTLYLDFDAVAAGVTTYNQVGHRREVVANVPWPMRYGMLSQLFPFWNTGISELPLYVESSAWARDVLSGLGYDHVRHIEMRFPPPLPNHPSAAREWDKARRALDDRRYDDCVAECRDVLAMWQKQLSATKDHPIATVIAAERKWGGEDRRTDFLDCLWKAAIDVANEPHHPEGQVVAQHFDAADARLLLTLTAALSQYLAGS